MGNLKQKNHEPVLEIQEGIKPDPILAEVRRARTELMDEIRKDPEKIHKRALQHARELGFKIAKLKSGSLKRRYRRVS